MRTALIVMSDGHHYTVSDAGETPYASFLARVRAAMIAGNYRNGTHPEHLVMYAGRHTCGAAEGAGECYYVAEARLGLWDGANWLTASDCVMTFRSFKEARDTAGQFVGVQVRPIQDRSK